MCKITKRLPVFFCFIVLWSINNSIVLAQADYGSTIEIIYSNLDMMNNSIYSMKSQMKNLEQSLNKRIKAQGNIAEENKTNISKNIYEIEILKKEMTAVDNAYAEIQKKYEEVLAEFNTIDSKIENKMLKVDSTFIDVNSEILDLKKKVLSLATHYFELKNQFARIPEFMFCQDCLPVFSFSSSINNYFTFNNENIKMPPSLSFDIMYYYNTKFSIWLNYNFPSFFSSTTDNDNESIKDNWNTNIISCGVYYSPMNSNTKLITRVVK